MKMLLQKKIQWDTHATLVILGDMELKRLNRINPIAKAMLQNRRRATILPDKKKGEKNARLHADRILEQWDTESKGSQTQED